MQSDRSRLSVGWHARVVAGIAGLGVADQQLAGGSLGLLGVHADAAGRVVVDDLAVVVPEDVVRGHGALHDQAGQVDGAAAVDVQSRAADYFGFALWKKRNIGLLRSV